MAAKAETPDIKVRAFIPGGHLRHELASRRNQKHSPLYKLPESLLIKIMLLLPSQDLCILRALCARFTQVSSLPAFARHHDPSYNPDTPQTPRDV